MSTKLLWESFALHAKLFPFHHIFPIGINAKKHALFCNTRSQMILISAIATALTFTWVVLVPIYLHNFHDFPSRADNYSVILFVTGVCISCDAIATLIYVLIWLHPDAIVKGFNVIVRIAELNLNLVSLSRFQFKIFVNKILTKISEISIDKETSYLTAYMVNKLILLMGRSVYICALFFILSDFDTTYFFLREIGIFPKDRKIYLSERLFSYLMRFPFAVSSLTKIFGIISFVIIISIILLQIGARFIVEQFHELRDEMITSVGNVRLRTLYISLLIGMNLLSALQAPITAALMAFGYLLIVIGTIATIRMWDVIPMPVYLIFPTIAMVTPLVTLMLLPRMSYCYEGSIELLRTWRKVTSWEVGVERWRRHGGRGSLESRINQRATAALQPCKLYASVGAVKLYVLKRSTKATFLYKCVETSVSGLVSFKL
ncbi:hypothetical protein Fcan01_10359 [Folsomia candida]|uniref:Uncharacterized protein n=1 Tax=Folsomia candida TaxID=158441 RepID=A0A226EAB8_FOLCA|nr:hypothetical protein Fcan01_10359 [Folsomia candida]